MAKTEKQKREARRTRRTAIGAVVLTLMAIGIIGIFYAGAAVLARVFDDSAERASLAEYLSPLVLLDPLPFNSIEEAPHDTLLQAAIWLSLNKEDISMFERDEFGSPLLPLTIIDSWALTLYGPNFKLQHKTFTDSGMEFLMLEDKQCYVIPITAQILTYIPEVTKIKNSGNEKRLTVGYKLPPGSVLGDIGTDSKPVKYLDYILKKIDKSFYIYAIVESATKAESTVSQSESNIDPDLLPELLLPDVEDPQSSEVTQEGEEEETDSEEEVDSEE